MDYLDFKNWKNTHISVMEDLTFSKPTDFFIYVRFTENNRLGLKSERVLFAETLQEAIGYIRHVFIYDILNDVVDDLELDFKQSSEETQNNALLLFNYWYKLGKIANENFNFLSFKKFCKDFNTSFSFSKNSEYEIMVLKGANALRNFLIDKYSNVKQFDKKRIAEICSNELFAGKPLKDFLDELFK